MLLFYFNCISHVKWYIRCLFHFLFHCWVLRNFPVIHLNSPEWEWGKIPDVKSGFKKIHFLPSYYSLKIKLSHTAENRKTADRLFKLSHLMRVKGFKTWVFSLLLNTSIPFLLDDGSSSHRGFKISINLSFLFLHSITKKLQHKTKTGMLMTSPRLKY